MSEHAQYSQEKMPMADILAEIRKRVSREAQASYEREHKQAKTELLILRPEARVDLLLMEAKPVAKPKPTPKPAKKPANFEEQLRAALQVSDKKSLEDLIRKVFREEMQAFGG